MSLDEIDHRVVEYICPLDIYRVARFRHNDLKMGHVLFGGNPTRCK
jgi:hypothetical protein